MMYNIKVIFDSMVFYGIEADSYDEACDIAINRALDHAEDIMPDTVEEV